ncbi:DUF885 family protein [Microbulbifer taiwanensis]|uniref:DUF885 family protein n=1 Tax=Microbulbifer taiwanensis TaxID=986746 RepID=A0ABW1YMS3_9GAMM|nr:DUF885 family protein [Microbulbifer taiwanensis]
MREKSEKALGGKFELREFHDVLLVNGALPLSLLEEQMDEAIED